ncbi:hypothetical protein DRQ25_05310, partial [Candidatus Fermentibacteria bacterium]
MSDEHEDQVAVDIATERRMELMSEFYDLIDKIKGETVSSDAKWCMWQMAKEAQYNLGVLEGYIREIGCDAG